jgi:inner membrane protein
MDNLTHTLAGAVLGEAGLKRRTALAMPTLLIGANLPDVDVIAILFGHSLSFRRGWTHGILALVVLPLLLALGMLAWDRWVRRRRGRVPDRSADPGQLLLIAYVAVFSHPLLDWLNTYGMRWLMPFDGRWYYGDALFIVDPWVWIVLLTGFLVARGRIGSGVGRLTVLAITIYAGTMLGTAAFGRILVEGAVEGQGIVADAVMVGPVPIDPNRRDVVIRAGDLYYTARLRWLPRPVLTIDDEIVVSNRDHPLARAAAGDPEASRFLRWSRFPFFVLDALDDRIIVRIDDLRYGTPDRPSWAAVRVELPAQPPPGGERPLQTALETEVAFDP